ncbi:sensor histidine kinase [Nitratireductor luteus]|uniref:sensor histidine kinase n=1 Tax=Nitratireductor luteus TaxID=2976980 RepID=UPI0022405136|nr:histidine kinase [Nitratireductor luteus]
MRHSPRTCADKSRPNGADSEEFVRQFQLAQGKSRTCSPADSKLGGGTQVKDSCNRQEKDLSQSGDMGRMLGAADAEKPRQANPVGFRDGLSTHSDRHAAVRRAIEQERLRIARDIHDHAGQQLVGMMLRLAAMEYRFADPSLRSSLVELRSILAQFGEELKAIAAGERCGVPQGNELIPALEKLLRDWEHETGIRIVFKCKVESGAEPSDATAEVAYRVVQEALTNVAKHARGASRVEVGLRLGAYSLHLRIEDDGPSPRVMPTMGRRSARGPNGIAGMCERLAEVGGELEIRRLPRRGTGLHVNIPIGKAQTTH